MEGQVVEGEGWRKNGKCSDKMLKGQLKTLIHL